MNKKAVIFDLDGTLLNTLDDITDSVNYTLSKLKRKVVSTKDVRAYLGNGAKGLWQKILKDDIALLEEALAIYLPYLESHSQIKTKPYPHIETILKKLKPHYKLAVVSNKHQEAVDQIVSNYFPKTFDVVIGERKGIPKKPNPAPLLLAIDNLSITLEDALFIGDSEVDIETGKNANVDVVGVTWGFRDLEQLVVLEPNFLIEDPRKILNILGV